MNDDRDQLLAKIKAKLEEPCVLRASDLLLDPDTRLVDGAPTHEEASHLLPTLKARLENSQRNGKLIFGLQQVIDVLVTFASTEVIVGYSFISPRVAGKIYLSIDEEIVGVTIVDR